MTRSLRTSAVALLLLALLPVPAASAATEPLDFVRKERQKRGPDEKTTWGALARNREQLRRLWDRYQQEGPLPVIRFKKNVAVLAGTVGSSTCPYRLHDLRLNRERKRIVARMYQEDYEEPVACTDDLAPRTFTVAVARADLRPLRPRELNVRARRIEDPNG